MYSYKTSNEYNIKNIFPGRCNCYLIKKNEITILVDTSLERHGRQLLKKLKNQLNNSQKIDFLILTHTHYDHAANAALVQNEFGSKIIVHSNEAHYLEKGSSRLPDGTNLFTKMIVWLGRNLVAGSFNFAPARADINVNNIYDFNETGLDIKVIHTPGHSAGSVSIIIDNEAALVGDTLFGVFSDSVFPFFADDVKTMINSWKILMNTDCRIFLPGHGTPIDRRRFENNFDKNEKKYLK